MAPDRGTNTAWAWVALGSNIGDRLATLRSAVRCFSDQTVTRTRLAAASSIYETRPIGPSVEPFLNAVIAVRTALEPIVLLRELLRIEHRHDRQRTETWGPRTLDLDLLVYHWEGARGEQRTTPELQLPHPRMHCRDFVLLPLCELIGDRPVHDGLSAHELVERIPPDERTILRKLDEGLL